MIRKIIEINEELCNGCGACAKACHEGAIGMVGGKAKLLRDDYCDGLGDCLPSCPTNAIQFVEREAMAYDEQAVLQNKKNKEKVLPCGCPGMQSKKIVHNNTDASDVKVMSQLSQWPVQIRLVPVNAPYFNNTSLLVAADCTAYAYGNFHNDFIKGKTVILGCPKFDSVDYSEKLTQIIRNNNINDITVVRMEVPCCGGLENAVKNALANSGKCMDLKVVTISTDGNIL